MSTHWQPLIDAATSEGRTVWVWFAVSGTAILVFIHSEQETVLRRSGEATSSGMIGIATGPPLATWADAPIMLAAVCSAAFGHGLLLGVRKYLQDPTAVGRILGRFFGNGQ